MLICSSFDLTAAVNSFSGVNALTRQNEMPRIYCELMAHVTPRRCWCRVHPQLVCNIPTRCHSGSGHALPFTFPPAGRFGSAIPGVRHSGGPPFRGIIVIITLTYPNPNPILTLTLTLTLTLPNPNPDPRISGMADILHELKREYRIY